MAFWQMENMLYAEELVKEFLIFRGFTNTLQVYQTELSTDIGKGFDVDKILDLVFLVYVPKFQAEKLVALLSFFKQYVSTITETVLLSTLSKLETSILRYYIVQAIQSGRKDKVVEFLGTSGNDLLQRGQDWVSWFDSNNGSYDAAKEQFNRQSHRDSKKGCASKQQSYVKSFSENSVSHSTSTLAEEDRQAGNYNISDSSKPSTCLTLPQSEHDSSLLAKHSAEGSESRDTYRMFRENYYSAENVEVQREEEFPELKIDFQETFLGHTSAITRCRFSASGSNIASASVDGTVRIWTYDSSSPTSRNAAIYCGAEIMSLDWECKSDRLCIGSEVQPPVEPIFVSAAASGGTGSSNLDNMKFASLTVWNMKAWKPMTVLPLGEDPPAITSLSFNHNGKILAAAATDGMIHIFGSDGKASPRLLVLRSTKCYCYLNVFMLLWLFYKKYVEIILRFGNHENSKNCRHEMALDSTGRRLIVSSGSVRSPIYQVYGHVNGSRTLPHSAAITTVDWHPTLPIFLTGSADNSVRVTSIF
ncbi:Wd repeat-containing protein, partial [Thalictrum thalictroides]